MTIRIKGKKTSKIRLHKMMIKRGEDMTTLQIYEMYNTRYSRLPFTMFELANILTRTKPMFVKVDRVRTAHRTSSSNMVGDSTLTRFYDVWRPLEIDYEAII